MTDGIKKISGASNGPTLALMAGVHGDELAGIMALKELASELKIAKGTLYIIIANPLAIKASVRFVNKNLNRCFYKGNKGKTPEDQRAREIMKVLDKCDALIDLHMFHGDSGKPFVICEYNALDIANKFDVEIISTGWSKAEPGGSDGYMYEQGKIGICIECGPKSQPEAYKEFAKQTALQTLKYFEMIDNDIGLSNQLKKIVKAKQTVYKTSLAFNLKPGLTNFQKLKAGQLIASDIQADYFAEDNDYIIFPHYSARVGEEAFIIGREV